MLCPVFCGGLLAIALILLALTLIPLLPVRGFVSDTVAHFLPLYPVAALAVLVLGIFTLAPGAVIFLSALAILLAVWQLRPFAANEQPVGPAPELKILQANLLVKNTDMARLRRLIEQEQPDIIALQEANSAAGELLASLAGDYPHQQASLQDQHSFGLAVASKQPLENFETLNFSRPHIPVFRFRQQLAGRDLDCVVLHVANPLRDYPSRSFDMEALADYLLAQPESPRIVTGDFNVTPHAQDYRLFARRLSLANARDSDGILRHYRLGSWPCWLWQPLRLAIDHTLHTNDLLVTRHLTGPETGSDHLPAVTSLTWK